MRKTLWLCCLAALAWGCAPPDQQPSVSTQTTTTVAVAASPQPIVSATPAEAMPAPDLPDAVLKPLEPVAALQPQMKETESWWANSGISENRLGYYASKKSPAEVEAELLPTFTKHKPYLEGIGPVFDFEGNRVCVMRRDDGVEEMFVLVPLGEPPVVPESLKALKLPAIPPEKLKGQSTLVVLATGKGLGAHVDHMLGQAGLVITPSPTP